MKKPELLAPAGNIESLIAAIEAGCDAVYLAGRLYGARSFASNFTNEQLIYAFNYCHLYGVKAYVTVNTLVYEDEVDNFIKYVEFLYENGVDAVIIQDIGMFDLIHKLYPKLEIHISTQMHIHNLEGAKLVEKLGASRVVLARETPIELVNYIKKNTNIELEIFVHGALCISYSGQCLMSSLIGGRSGNRGTCAQCCRQPYDLYCNDEKISSDKYLLSTRDLNTIENIGELIDANVDSLKIEGRMKRPEYVYLVVSLYRKAIDSYYLNKKIAITEKDIYELKKIFNRKFTKGFLFNTDNSKFINSFRPNHLGVEIGKVINVSNNKIKIKLSDNLNINDGIRFVGKDDIGMVVQSMYKNNIKIRNAYKDEVITIISGLKINNDSIILKTTDIEQLKDIQNLIVSRNRKIKIDVEFLAYPGKQMELKIIDEDNNEINVKSDYIVETSIKMPTTKENILKQLNKLGDTNYAINNYNINITNNTFIPVKIINDLRRIALDKLNKIRQYTKKFIKGEYYIDIPDLAIIDNFNSDIIKVPRVQEKLREISGNLLVGELGSVYKYCNGLNYVTTDFSLNVTNSYSVALLHSLGVNKVTLSVELNDYQIKKIIERYCSRYGKKPNLELIVEGPLEAMILKYDIFNGKYNSKCQYYLKDKYGNKFPVLRKDNLTYIYFYEKLNKDKKLYYDYGINSLRKIL